MTMPQGWQELPLNRIIRMRSGDFISNDDIESEGPYPVYGGNGLRGFSHQFNTTGPIVLVGRQGAHCGNVHVADGQIWVSEHALRCLPERELDAKWLAYTLGHMNLNQYSVSAAQPGLSVDNLKHLRKAVPPRDIQRRIARFLDERTARIDELIEKKRALLDRLAEKRQALITGAVTKGLNSEALMKPSGIDWLGDIPAHWEVKRLGHVSQILLGLTYSPSHIVDEGNGIFVIRASNIQNGQLVRGDDVFVNADVSESIISRLGDIVVCSRNGSRNLIGKNAIVTEEWVGCTFGVFMTTVRTELSDWVRWVLASTLFEFQSGRYMSTTINQLTISTLKSFPIPIPPKQQAHEISKEIRRLCSSLDAQHELIVRSVEKLAEYRSALITAAVTGQLVELR